MSNGETLENIILLLYYCCAAVCSIYVLGHLTMKRLSLDDAAAAAAAVVRSCAAVWGYNSSTVVLVSRVASSSVPESVKELERGE